MFFDKSRKIDWCSNRLVITGNAKDLTKLKLKMGREFTAPYTYNIYRDSFSFKPKRFTNPIFAFWNLDLFTSDEWRFWTDACILEGRGWDSWNITHWGISFDVAVADNEINPTTQLIVNNQNMLEYRFRTGNQRPNSMFDTPAEGLSVLSDQFPKLNIKLYYKYNSWSEEADLSWPIKFDQA